MDSLTIDPSHLIYVNDQHIKTVREHPDKMWNRWTYEAVQPITGERKRVVKRYVHYFDGQSNTLPLYRGTKTPKTSDLDIFRGVVVYWNAPNAPLRQLRPRQSDWVTSVTFHIPLPPAEESTTAAKSASSPAQKPRARPLQRTGQPRRNSHSNNGSRRLRRVNTSLIARRHSVARADELSVPKRSPVRSPVVEKQASEVEMLVDVPSPEASDVHMASVADEKGSYLAPLKWLFGYFVH